VYLVAISVDDMCTYFDGEFAKIIGLSQILDMNPQNNKKIID